MKKKQNGEFELVMKKGKEVEIKKLKKNGSSSEFVGKNKENIDLFEGRLSKRNFFYSLLRRPPQRSVRVGGSEGNKRIHYLLKYLENQTQLQINYSICKP